MQFGIELMNILDRPMQIYFENILEHPLMISTWYLHNPVMLSMGPIMWQDLFVWFYLWVLSLVFSNFVRLIQAKNGIFGGNFGYLLNYLLLPLRA